MSTNESNYNPRFWGKNQLWVFYSVFYFVEFSGKYHEKCLPILYAYLNGCHQLKHSKCTHCINLTITHRSLMNQSFSFTSESIQENVQLSRGHIFPSFHSSCDLDWKPFLDYKLAAQADVTTTFYWSDPLKMSRTFGISYQQYGSIIT